MDPIPATDLLINPDGSIYHLHLKPEDLADLVIVVGDPGRVPGISSHFSRVETVVQNREFVSHTGIYRGKRITALSTGIGIDNIDIVMNELDALANIDLEKRTPRPGHRRLRIVRIGTSGAIQPDIPLNSFAVASFAMGMDDMMRFYRDFEGTCDTTLAEEFIRQTGWDESIARPYFIPGSAKLVELFGNDALSGITLTAPGFYGPQGRSVRLPLADDGMIRRLWHFKSNGLRILNFEMEAAALYGLGAMLGHETVTICALIANRAANAYNPDHCDVMDRLNRLVLDKLTEE